MMELIEKIKRRQGFRAKKPMSNEAVCKAEKELELNFSTDFRECIKAFGSFSIEGHEIVGVCDSDRLNVVFVTKQEKSRNNVSSNWYVIEQLHIDGIVIWQDENGVVYQSQPNKDPVKIANSLLEYLEY